jgi:hypothetical protein
MECIVVLVTSEFPLLAGVPEGALVGRSRSFLEQEPKRECLLTHHTRARAREL